MKRLNEVLNGDGGSYILPFLWMRGEDNATIARELDKIQDCGIREVCLESRPHPDFLGPLWWHNLDFIMAEARMRQMRVWVLDDAHFPTGFAGGAFRDKCPDQAKIYLAERHMDIVGPKMDAAVLISPFLGDDGQLVAVLASKMENPETTELSGDEMLVLTDRVCHGFVYLDIPDGRYRLSVIFTTRKGGGQENYMNLIDSASVRVLIDAVYEPHYRRYAADFGHTFAGFFSDEPELGNAAGYDFHELPGRLDKKLPWSRELEQKLRYLWKDDYAANLAALWYEAGAETARIRTEYMDAMTNLVYTCFSDQVGRWCEAHGVEYIGHIIEDDNAHARMGCSIGHYFKEMRGQHRAGVDVVHFQIVPGFEDKTHQWMTWDSDGEFFHYGLAKLGASAAHIDSRKQGRSLCEIFGNYGWAFGVSQMLWLTNHMLVRGINHFTPHAFSMKFPDRDCPPHFYAQGNNPQFEHFTYLMKYMNRVCHLLCGGIHVANAAVLYHGEASWGGREHMLFQKPGRVLMEQQLDYDVVPEYLFDPDDMDAARVSVGDNGLVVNSEVYPCLVIPYCERISDRVMHFVEEHTQLPVYVIDGLPEQTTRGRVVSEAFKAAVRVIELGALSGEVRGFGTQLEVAGEYPHLRTYVYKHADGMVYMLFNEDTTKCCQTVVTLKHPWRSVVRVDAMDNHIEALPVDADGKGFRLSLEPGGAVILVGSNDIVRVREPFELSAEKEVITDWKLSLKAAGCQSSGEGFHYERTLRAGEILQNMNGPDMFPEFSGTFRYEGTFFMTETDIRADKTELYLREFGDCVQVYINGQPAAALLASPGRADITPYVKAGRNEITVDVTNTLVWQVRDPVSVFLQLNPTGLLENPELKFYKQAGRKM